MDKSRPRMIGLMPPSKLLAAARVLAGITQQELAEAAGLTTASLARYESGASTMRTDSLGAIVTALREMGIRFVGETHDVALGVVLVKEQSGAGTRTGTRKPRKAAE